jgi:DNA-binding SARP family transcriptional activator
VEVLAAKVWDGDPPPSATATLRNYVKQLRRLLGPAAPRLETTAAGYRLNADAQESDLLTLLQQRDEAEVAARSGDWDRMEQLCDQALSLWRGPALVDIACPALHREEVPQLDRIYMQMHELKVEAGLRLGHEHQLIEPLYRLVDQHPLHERFHAQLMISLASVGRRAEALEAYRTARRILVDELGIEPGPELQAAQREILSTTAAPPDNPAQSHGVPAQPQDVPRQLPVGIGNFTGRHAELDTLLDLGSAPVTASRAPGTALIAAIDGMAGVGKTALAVMAAHRLADRFPDGQLFIDLHGYTQGYEPRSAGEALEMLLRALDVSPQRIPHDVDERAALYRQTLAGSRTLVLLDNAQSAAQVRPLLPASEGCLVLVTSRRRLKGLDEAYPVPLDVLPHADALALLHTVTGDRGVPADDGALAEVAEACGRLPLALRIAAALLRHRPTWTLQHLADLLREQDQRIAALADGERDLGVVFDLSYAHLTTAQQHLFRHLGLVPGPDLDAYAAAALTNNDHRAATRLLEDLVDHNLLIQHTHGRYRLHDLLRVHARALTIDESTNDRRAALERLLDYYQHTANRADATITPYPRPTPQGSVPACQPRLPDQSAAWAWLRTERPNLLACLRQCADDDHDRCTVVLTHGLATLLLTDGPWTDATTLHSSAAKAAEKVGDRAGRASALFYLGDIRLLTGDYQGAARDFHQSLQLCRDVGDRRGQANALNYLGYVRTLTGDHLGAAADLLDALRMYRETGERLGQANALTRLGTARGKAGDYSAALRDLQAALQISRDIDDRRGQAFALANIAETRLRTGDHQGLEQDLNEALQLYRDLGDDNGEGNALACLGELARLTGDHPAAIRRLESALELYRRIGARGNEAWALYYYAATFSATGDHTRALSLYQDALLLAREVHQSDDEARSLEGIADCHLHKGDAESSTLYLKQALDIFQRLAMTSDANRVRARLTVQN